MRVNYNIQFREHDSATNRSLKKQIEICTPHASTPGTKTNKGREIPEVFVSEKCYTFITYSIMLTYHLLYLATGGLEPAAWARECGVDLPHPHNLHHYLDRVDTLK